MALIQHSAQHNMLRSGTKLTTIDLVGGINCHICNSTFGKKKEFDSHYSNHTAGNSETVYTCVVCYKQFSGYKSFQGHCYLNHVSKDKYKCQYCPKTCTKLSLLTQHELSVHNFTCMICGQRFPTKNELSVHGIIHKIEKNKPPYPCTICKKMIENSDICEMHIDEHSKASYPCPICEVTIPNKLDAAKHLTKHFGDSGQINECDLIKEINSPFENSSIDIVGGILCCFCNDSFKTRKVFDDHFISDHSDKDLVYTCLICKKKYQNYYSFVKHCHFHTNKNKFDCNECGKIFPRLSLFVMHSEAFHSGQNVEKPYECVICNYSFKSHKRLDFHMYNEHSLTEFICTQCGDIFNSHRNMLLHRREHDIDVDKNKNWCRHCCMNFTSLASCEKHLDIHRIKKYSCPICNKDYKEKYQIVKHISVHFESVLHICKFCSKTYNRKGRLQEHLKTHAQVKSYKCSHCDKAFAKAYDLQQHINVHTGAKPYKCEFCEKSFAGAPNWSKHLQKMHNVEYNERKKMLKIKENLSNNKQSMNTVKETVSNEQSDESMIEEIDPEVVQKELEMLNDNNNAKDWEMFGIEDMLLENTAIPVAGTLDSIEPSIQGACVPPEYGPDFVNRDLETSSTINGDYIDLDDHIMPHIDPHLTINNQISLDIYNQNIIYDQNNAIYEQTNGVPNGWEPPITKCHINYYPSNDITDFPQFTSL